MKTFTVFLFILYIFIVSSVEVARPANTENLHSLLRYGRFIGLLEIPTVRQDVFQ
jgi:hypothetical protein